MPVFAVVVFYSCSDSSDKRILTNLYKKREYLLREFNDKSIINRGNKFFQLSYYKGKSVNTFFFEKEGDTLVLINDSLQYPVNEINAFVAVNHADSSYYTTILVNELSRLLNVMDSLKIKNVSAEFAPLGVDMKLYFGHYKALLYISDISAIRNEQWKNYIKSGKKLDRNWYFVEDELKIVK
jgi:hypothetical protein